VKRDVRERGAGERGEEAERERGKRTGKKRSKGERGGVKSSEKTSHGCTEIKGGADSNRRTRISQNGSKAKAKKYAKST